MPLAGTAQGKSVRPTQLDTSRSRAASNPVVSVVLA